VKGNKRPQSIRPKQRSQLLGLDLFVQRIGPKRITSPRHKEAWMKPTRLKERQRDILRALHEMGGRATVAGIANKLELSANGVSQTLSALCARSYVSPLDGKGANAWWVLCEPPKDESGQFRLFK
jgi:uncharacterized membrane protein